MNYTQINKCDFANGPGARVSLFVSGCRVHCKQCFNQESQCFSYGEIFNYDTQEEIIELLKPSYIKGLSILGGEPLEPENIKVLMPFIRFVKELYPNKSIWLYSGYNLNDETKIINTTELNTLYKYVDVLVEGPFKYELRDTTLKFRGSSNQRLIDITRTIELDKITLLDDTN